MLARLKELNPTLALYDVTDPEFARYGRIVEMDTDEILRSRIRPLRKDRGNGHR